MTVNSLIENNLAPIAGLFFLFVVLVKNEVISDRSKKMFLVICFLELFELVTYNLELVTAQWDRPTVLRMFLSAVGYSIRPMMIYVMIQMLREKGGGRRKEIFLFLPEFLNIIGAFSVFFTNIVYSYNNSNVFQRGPLGYITQLCVVFYLFVFAVAVVRKQFLDKNVEMKIMLLIFAYIVLSMILEAVFSVRGIGRTAIVLSTIFFMYALQTSLLKKHIHVLAENEELKNALKEVERAKQELIRSQSVTQALGEEYSSVFLVDLANDSITAVKVEEGYELEGILEAIHEKVPINECVRRYAEKFLVPDQRKEFLEEFSRENLRKELIAKSSITKRLNCTLDGNRTFYVEIHIVRTSQEALEDGFVLGFRNVEELVEKEQRQLAVMREAMVVAERANVAKANFLSRMSHDIRTPLNGIIGLLKIDQDHFEEKELLLENHKKMQVSANYLLSLLNDMLQMSKLEDGNVVLTHEWISLVELTKDIVTIIIGRAVEAGIEWDYEKDKSVIPYPYIYGSPLHLRQIFLNIYGNCIKYNRPGGKITTIVDTLEEKDGICTYRWTITDTGVGMSEEFLEHIFEPFAQEKNDARSVYHGTGLGMAIVKGLLDQMGGEISITSEEGVGSTFVICIPFEIAEPPGKEQMEEKLEESDIRGRHLMLVEDNELNAEIAEMLLSDQGARITTVHDGKQAVELFNTMPAGTFDAILMDIMMPEMDGLTATRKIRQLERQDAGRIPIIAMTANAFKEDEERCLAAGMNAHLAKPLDIEKVKRTIQREIERCEGNIS